MAEMATTTRHPRTAVVTGGGSGIGLAIVERLLSSDHRVGFFSRGEPTVEQARSRLADRFPPDAYLSQALDVSDEDALVSFISSIEATFGPVDVLVNNAGISPKTASPEAGIAGIGLEEWNRVLAVNLTGAFLASRRVMPLMKERGFGRIVNISSLAARTMPQIARAHYTASKAGLIGFSRALAREGAAHGVTVNCIAPGRIVTDMTGPPDSSLNQSVLSRIPVGRLGQPTDVAAMVAFLVSDEADFITGVVLDINGGEVCVG